VRRRASFLRQVPKLTIGNSIEPASSKMDDASTDFAGVSIE